jgi:serine/threonine protein kinase/tetratricopeptide (TPR) repeat protein
MSPAIRAELQRGSSVGRYLLLDKLGEGGMGVVYKAYDPELDRTVALKLLPADSEGQSERLLREAQALAQLQHPNVIAVYDVGIFGGDVFVAMEFVAGQNARQWIKEEPRSQDEILDVFLAAGEGLAAAHRAGLIHRDFKPDNVVVGKDGRARVLDFGLARTVHLHEPEAAAHESLATAGMIDEEDTVGELRSARRAVRAPEPAPPPTDSGRFSSSNLLGSPLTHAGAIVGTPRFMAPEQHLGDAIDARADQFSFCVSLYWALYRSFPFDGELDSLLRGQLAPPPPNATVPRWLRQVLLRGLGIKPEARFDSMAELLAALRADPRLARRRWLRGAALAIAATAVVVAIGAGGLAYKVRSGSAQQSKMAQRFGQEVEKIASISRFSALMPLHDTRPELSLIREHMQQLSESLRPLGPLAVGPGHEALGRGFLALDRWDDALRELEQANASGYRSHELAYALGLTHGKLYQRALAAVHKTGDAKADAEKLAAIAHAHRDPALRYLREAGSRESGADAAEYVEGLIALYEQRFDEALVLARKAYQRVPWLFEARTLEGDIHLMAGRERSWKGEIDAASEHFDRAGEAYRAAAAIARSSAAAHLGECERLIELSNLAVERDQSPEATVKAALSACSDAATASPDDAVPVEAQALAWHHLGNFQVRHSGDPTAAQEQAIRLAQAALKLDPGRARAEHVIARAGLMLGERSMEGGGDPRASLAQAIEHAERAGQLSHDPDHALLCHIYYSRGNYEEMHGDDPRASYRSAIEHAKQACELEPDGFNPWNALGSSNLAFGGWEATHGYDPTPAYLRAIEAYRKVTQIVPKLDHGFVNLCSAYLNLGEYDLKRQIDPTSDLNQAIDSCNQAIRIDGNFGGSQLNLGYSLKALAAWQVQRGVDPVPTLERSRAAIQRALTIDRGNPEPLVPLVEGRLIEARWALVHGKNADAALAAADAAGRRALIASDGKSADALRLLAEVHRWRAEGMARRQLGVATDVREGLAMAARALERNPRLALAAAAEGALHLVAARTARSVADRAVEAKQARAALERALAIDGSLDLQSQPLLTEATRLEQP